MRALKTALVLIISLGSLVAAALGLHAASRSALFLVRVVEINSDEDAPVDAHAITQLADIKPGEVNLFDLDISAVERRILSNVWVKEVRIDKRFPETISISVIFREPRALMQVGSGSLAYVDSSGVAFGQASLLYRADLPVLAGFSTENPKLVREALRVLDAWEKKPTHKTQVSSIIWDKERGFRALVTYLVESRRNENRQASPGRVSVELGQEIDDDLDLQFLRLSKVFQYLSSHGIAARQIFADSGKKMVVRSAHGS